MGGEKVYVLLSDMYDYHDVVGVFSSMDRILRELENRGYRVAKIMRCEWGIGKEKAIAIMVIDPFNKFHWFYVLALELDKLYW